MYEHRKQRLASRSVFLHRLARSFVGASLLIGISLALGICGYHFIEEIPWIDAYQESAMILSGMGPTAAMRTDLGKLFAGSYALYSGLMLVASVGVLLAPIVHRFFHKFHMDVEEKS